MSKLLLALILLISTACFAASSAQLKIHQNCDNWGQIAKVVVIGKNEGRTKEDVLGNIRNRLTDLKVNNTVIDDVILNMSLVYDQQPRGRNPEDIYTATYLACWEKTYEKGSK